MPDECGILRVTITDATLLAQGSQPTTSFRRTLPTTVIRSDHRLLTDRPRSSNVILWLGHICAEMVPIGTAWS